MRRYREPVFRLAVSVLGQAFAPEAEDVAQDVMLRVHHALGSFRGESTLGSWIYRIAFNRALNVKARARYRTPHVSDQALAATASQIAARTTSCRTSGGSRRCSRASL